MQGAGGEPTAEEMVEEGRVEFVENEFSFSGKEVVLFLTVSFEQKEEFAICGDATSRKS